MEVRDSAKRRSWMIGHLFTLSDILNSVPWITPSKSLGTLAVTLSTPFISPHPQNAFP